MNRKKLVSIRGFTLTEVLFSVGLLIVALAPLVITYANARARIDIARELSFANDDARDTLEKIKSAPFPAVTTQFPPDTEIDPTIIGGYSLPNENIVVAYPSGAAALPLVIEVSVSWTSRNGMAHNQVYRTSRTQMT
jgi:type II secretory pathway pseudopilin PulG